MLEFIACIYSVFKSFFDPAPNIVNGNAEQDDDETGDRVFRFGDQKIEAKQDGKNDVDNGNDRVAKCAIRALCIGAIFAKNKNTCDGENVKKHNGKHDIIEQCSVLT